MEKFLNALLYGKHENRLNVTVSLGVPDNVDNPPAPEVADKPHIAVVNKVLKIWDPVAQEWEDYAGGGTGGGGVVDKHTEVTDGADVEYTVPTGKAVFMVVLKCIEELTDAKVGTTPGGDDIYIGGEVVAANSYKAISCFVPVDNADTPPTIYVSGLTGDTVIHFIYFNLNFSI